MLPPEYCDQHPGTGVVPIVGDGEGDEVIPEGDGQQPPPATHLQVEQLTNILNLAPETQVAEWAALQVDPNAPPLRDDKMAHLRKAIRMFLLPQPMVEMEPRSADVEEDL